MTTFIVLRHAQSTANERGVLAGQLPGVHLTATGVSEAEAVRSALCGRKIDRIFTSPLERCLETVEPLAANRKLKVVTDNRLIEMNYGKWSGKKLKLLSIRPLWRTIQIAPSQVRFPDGESFVEMAERVRDVLDSLRRKFPNDSILLVTHGDITKFIATYFLELPLDHLQKFVVKPASLSIYHCKKDKVVIELFNGSQFPSTNSLPQSTLGGETGSGNRRR